MDDLYFEINPKENKILGPPTTLDINWNNIFGIIFLSKEELYDLTWAGYPDSGFIKICSDNKNLLKSFTYEESTLNLIKSKWRSIISELRLQKEQNPIKINDAYAIQLTEKFKLNMLMKYNECLSEETLKFNWKTPSGFVEFESKEFLKLYKKIQIYIQKLFDLEYEFYKKIEECKDIESLLNLELKLDYPDKISL